MSEFQSDIGKEYDEEGNELDKHGFRIKGYPDGLESVRKSVENCEDLCGFDRHLMKRLLDGEWAQYSTLDMNGRISNKIVIEYDIKHKDK